ATTTTTTTTMTTTTAMTATTTRACHSRCSTDGWHYGKQECLSAVLARAIAEALGKRSGLARSVWPAEYGHKTRDLPRREAPLPSGGSRQVERLVGAAEGSRASVEVTPPDLQVAGLGPLAAESPVEVLAVADDGHPLLGPLRQPRQEPPEAAPVGPVHERLQLHEVLALHDGGSKALAEELAAGARRALPGAVHHELDALAPQEVRAARALPSAAHLIGQRRVQVAQEQPGGGAEVLAPWQGQRGKPREDGAGGAPGRSPSTPRA
ncbi:unnamed protein product, partial [Prorocentrum cordatum]